MPITGRTPQQCFNEFRDHIATLVAATLTRDQVILVRPDGNRRVLGFHRGDLTTVPLKTRAGTLHFYLSQMLEAEKERDHYRLRTHRYWYKLYARSGLKEQALLRWEYDSELSPDRPLQCRHHVHLDAKLPAAALDLDKAHLLPTGWVTIEEVIRFLIIELGVKPHCGKNWPEKLATSEEAFYARFTSKRFRPLPRS